MTGLANFANRAGITGALNTFRQSDTLAEFARNIAQERRDKRAREDAARRGALKDLQSRIDRGDFGGNNNAGKDTSGASGGAPGGGADASTY